MRSIGVVPCHHHYRIGVINVVAPGENSGILFAEIGDIDHHLPIDGDLDAVVTTGLVVMQMNGKSVTRGSHDGGVGKRR